MAINPSGPFLNIACFCEGITNDEDGPPTIHRVIDALSFDIQPDAPPDFPSQANPILRTLWFLLVFKTDSPDGQHHLRIVCEFPDHTTAVITETTLQAKPMDNGCSLGLEVTLEIVKPGCRWFRVELDGEPVTKVPLLIFLERLR